MLTAGTIILVRGVGPLGFLLRTLGQSPADHARIALGDGRAVEAKASGVRIAAERQPGDGCAYLLLPPNAAVGCAAAREAQRHVGERYGFATYPLLLVRFLWGSARALTLGTALRGPFICSALAADCARIAGWDPAPGVPTRLVTPGDLITSLLDTLEGEQGTPSGTVVAATRGGCSP